jgi:hypothetical protein
MARVCAICSNQMASFVREKFKEYPTQPSAVIRAIRIKYDMDITYAQLKNHRKMHDPVAGTLIQARRNVLNKQLEVTEMLESGRQIIANLEQLLVKGTSMEEVNWDQFAKLPITEQIAIMVDLHKLGLGVKSLELKQKAMSQEKNAMLMNMNQMAANTFKSKPVQHAEEE